MTKCNCLQAPRRMAALVMVHASMLPGCGVEQLQQLHCSLLQAPAGTAWRLW